MPKGKGGDKPPPLPKQPSSKPHPKPKPNNDSSNRTEPSNGRTTVKPSSQPRDLPNKPCETPPVMASSYSDAGQDISMCSSGPSSLPAQLLSSQSSSRLPTKKFNKTPHSYNSPSRTKSNASCNHQDDPHRLPLNQRVPFTIELKNSPPANIPKSRTNSSIAQNQTKVFAYSPDIQQQPTTPSGLRRASEPIVPPSRGPKPKFEEYLPLSEVQKALKKGEVIEGLLRINPRNFNDAYLTSPGEPLDINITGMKNRNRALNGDKVAVMLNPKSEWKILYDTISANWHEWSSQSTLTANHSNSATSVLAEGLENLALDPIVENEVPNLDADDSSAKEKPVEIAQSDTETNGQQQDAEVKLKKRRQKRKPKNAGSGSNENTNKPLTVNGNVVQIPIQGLKASKMETKREKNISDAPQTNEPSTSRAVSNRATKLTPVKPKSQRQVLSSNNNQSPKDVKISSGKGPQKAPSPRKEEEKKAVPEWMANFRVEDLLFQPFGAHCIQKTGKVVQILESNHSRIAGGKLRLSPDEHFALFSPVDSRIPRLYIPLKECPPDFKTSPGHYEGSLFIAEILSWSVTDTFPKGRLVRCIGSTGDIEAETQMILMEHTVDDREFSEEDYVGIPGLDKEQWTIPEEETASRFDFRDECVFTIDPATARDLDDALSIRELDESHQDRPLYEVGVHIADVSYFLKESMPLDFTARHRTTSIYLVQKVIPMLPRILCEKHCSLTPGEDKLTFSVWWKMDLDGNVYEEKFGRTVINSCVKLSYDHAQDMINEPDREWSAKELPSIFNSRTPQQISWCVNKLMTISRALRKKRFDGGALRIDKMKLSFVLDPESGMPSGFTTYSQKESNYLVEELMLLANMAVAHKIEKAFESLAFLRNHPAPDEKLLHDLQSFCKFNNYDIDSTSSATLQKSLTLFTANHPDHISKVISHYLLRSMKNALYFCAGSYSSKDEFHHYALNVPLYTHFTSPIRRYPDVIVHRLLASSLDSLGYRTTCPTYFVPFGDTPDTLKELAKVCNERKTAARLVSESSAKLFLSLYIKDLQPHVAAVVIQVLDHSLDVLIIEYGQQCRVFLENVDLLKRFQYRSGDGVPSMQLIWEPVRQGDTTKAPEICQTIKRCSLIEIQVKVNQNDLQKWFGVALHPSWYTTDTKPDLQ